MILSCLQLRLFLLVDLGQLLVVGRCDDWGVIDIADDALHVFILGVLLQVLELELAQICLA